MKRYIGDGAYVDYDGYSLVLTTSDGIRDTNTIVMEPEVYAALLEYVEDLKAKAAALKLECKGNEILEGVDDAD